MAIHPNMTFADYLALPHYGSSDLRTFKVGPPANVPWRRANRTDGTEATRIGTAAHCRILTPTLYESTFAHKPEGMTFASKEGQAWRDQQHGRDILTHDEHTIVAAVDRAFWLKDKRHPLIVKDATCEASLTWRCEATGLPCKGRPDWFDKAAVYDLKVSRIADRPVQSMVFAAYAAGYLNQLAHNRAGLAAIGIRVAIGRLVVISPTPPHPVHLLEVRENDMDFLELDNINTRRGMVVCHESGVWPGTPDTWTTIELPASAAFTESDLEGAVSAEENPLV